MLLIQHHGDGLFKYQWYRIQMRQRLLNRSVLSKVFEYILSETLHDIQEE